MLCSEQKPLEEILGYLDGERSVFLIGCRGCAEGCESGGKAQVEEMEERLEREDKRITGRTAIDMVCNEHLSRLRLAAYRRAIDEADSILVMTCGVGVQTVAGLIDKMVHPGCNTLSSGGRHAAWKEAERCLECGDCILEYTGGICPIARCPKHLLHGPCGGSQRGRCEVSPDIPCAWQIIIERLMRIGKLEKLEGIRAPKDWSVSLIGGLPARRS